MNARTLPAPSRILGPTLWVAQALLALFFAFAGITKLTAPAEQLAASMPWTVDYPALVPVTGVVDLLGGLGILLPALTRILPRLTPSAAAGLIALQVVALVFHVARGEAAVVPMNLVLIALATFVLWGRTRALPVASR